MPRTVRPQIPHEMLDQFRVERLRVAPYLVDLVPAGAAGVAERALDVREGAVHFEAEGCGEGGRKGGGEGVPASCFDLGVVRAWLWV